MVNLEWYRTFKSVYKNGNFSNAAKELFISQPAVSQLACARLCNAQTMRAQASASESARG